MPSEKANRLKRLSAAILTLTEEQLAWLEKIVGQFRGRHSFARSHTSNLITPRLLEDFGDVLRIHHCFSHEPFSKDKFEHAMDVSAKLASVPSMMARRGNPGHDLTLAGQRFALKTQADSSIRPDEIHISKFMELGKGQWGDRVEDLDGLRQQFLRHMTGYDRILVLRCLNRGPSAWHYELIEIPKSLLQEAKDGQLEVRLTSRQTPKPGYCHVRSPEGKLKFQLYFDGGGERKLQVKRLRKDLCVVHAEWRFVMVTEGERPSPESAVPPA